jgi:eukaryotic-like serine/threonine-protein kinase
MTRPSLRVRGGRVCPRCRYHVDDPPGAKAAGALGPIVRCPVDGLALVTPEALMAADGDPFLGATVAGRFVVLGRLGAGSMGTVYRARQEAMGRDVAVKILRSDRALDAMAKARFAREAHAMSLLSSPHTVTVFDFGEIPDPHADELAPAESSLYLAMELLLGEPLGARLKRGKLPVEDAARIAREVLLSLEEAHEKGIIHRDLKPDNIFLSRAAQGEIVKVLDFGIAKLRAEPSVDALETQAGTVFGTPRYMSPEQAQGKDLDARSDLYTLGVLLYQMLVGRAPFIDDDAVVVMARHIKSTPVTPLDAAPDAPIGAALSALVMRALAKDPGARPPTAQAFRADLDRVMRERGGALRARATAAASGEVAAMVHDGLGGAPSTARRFLPMARTRSALLVVTSAAVMVAGGLFAMGALRPPRVPSARAELAHLVAARRLVVLQAEAAARGAASAAADTPVAAEAPRARDVTASGPRPRALAEPSASASAPEAIPTLTPVAGPPKGTWRRYKKFDP